MLLLFSKIRDKEEVYFYCLLSISYEEYFGTLFYARVFPCERRTASSFDCAPTVFEKHCKKSHFSNCGNRSELRLRKDVFFCNKIAVEPFLINCNKDILSFVQLFSNLLNKLLNKKNCLKESIYLLQLTKNGSTEIFLQKNTYL